MFEECWLHEKVSFHHGTDCLRTTTGLIGDTGIRLLEDGFRRADILPMEEEIYRDGCSRSQAFEGA